MYSLRQLEAFNALSPSEKLKLQTNAAERRAQLAFASKPKETFQANNIKVEVVDEYRATINKTEQHQQQQQPLNIIIENTSCNDSDSICRKPSPDLLIVPEDPIQRVLIANQLNNSNSISSGGNGSGAGVAKANPKTVTASVFKTIPIESVAKQQLLQKTINANGVEQQQQQQLCSNGNGAPVARAAPQTITASLIQPIVAVKRDSFGKTLPPTIIAKPSLVPRQTVVTASLFQPRSTAAIIGPNITQKNFPSTTVNQQASRAAEIMNKSFCLSDDLSQPTCEYICTTPWLPSQGGGVVVVVANTQGENYSKTERFLGIARNEMCREHLSSLSVNPKRSILSIVLCQSQFANHITSTCAPHQYYY